MDIDELITRIAKTPAEIADQALEEYVQTYGENNAVRAAFAIASEIRAKQTPGTICR